MKQIYFITGASGVGKTTLSELVLKTSPNTKVVHFDSIGIPPYEEMIKEYGSMENFQRDISIKWINKLVNEYKEEIIFFEGQVNLDYIVEGFKKNNFDNYSIILIDCSKEEMKKRLIERGQPELANSDMYNWQIFLRRQAVEKGCRIIDSTNLTKDEMVNKFLNLVDYQNIEC